MFVGIDWASRAHELCVVDKAGTIVRRFECAQSEHGISEALARLAKLASPGELPVAIERPDGLLVDRLLEANHSVVPIHPNAFHAARPRWEGAGSKSDPGDAYRLADLLHSDHYRLRPLRPLDVSTRELPALVRLRDDHVAARAAATNHLAALLGQHWPGAAAIFGRLDSEIALDFLDRYPTPASAARLSEARLASFLRRHSYCGRRSAAEPLARLRQAPRPVHALDAEVVGELVRAQARLVRTLLSSIAQRDRAIAVALDQHGKPQLLRPLPRMGTISLERTSSAEEAAALCGAVPVTRRSGRQHAACFRYATNAKARKALTLYADNSRHASPWVERIYREARARGCRHPHAVRILARACWHTDTPYDPARCRGRDRHPEPTHLTEATHAWSVADRLGARRGHNRSVTRYDAIVVGAGPAGSVTAFRLASAGASVLLVDKARFPRDKPCGGGLTLRAIRELPIDVTPVVEHTVDRMQLRVRYGAWYERRSDGPLILMTQRRRLDAFLAERAAAAGAAFRDGAKVTAVTVQRDRVEATVDGATVQGEVLVGADGANGVSARQLALGGEPVYGVALEGNLPYEAIGEGRYRSKAVIELAVLPGGYGWVFPKGDHANFGVGGWERTGPTLRDELRRLCAEHRVPEERLESIRGHRLPLRRPDSPLARGRALVVGDAAGLVDPLSGDGMYEAFVSSRLAADATAAVLEGRAATVEPYDQALRQALGRLAGASWNAKLAFDRFPRLAFALSRPPFVWPVVENILRGELQAPGAARGIARVPIRAVLGFAEALGAPGRRYETPAVR